MELQYNLVVNYTEIEYFQFIQSTTIRGHGSWNAEEKILLHVPTLNVSKGVANGTTIDNADVHS